MKSCPRCNAPVRDSGQVECSECGVILAKALAPEIAAQQRKYRRLKRGSGVPGSGEGAAAIGTKQSFLLGTAVAIVIYAIPYTRFVLSYLAILIHELGHTFVGTLFGYPSIPTFDFLYGGGVTFNFGRSTVLLVVLGLAWIGGIYTLRHWRRLQLIVAGLGAVWLAAAMTSVHDVLMNASGHGAELVFAAWCFYKCVSGNVRSSTERWLYAMCGSFLVLSAWMFALRLVESAAARQEYGHAKGGGHWMDMSRIARYFDTELVPVALVYWLLATALPAAIYLLYINRQRLVAAVFVTED